MNKPLKVVFGQGKYIISLQPSSAILFNISIWKNKGDEKSGTPVYPTESLGDPIITLVFPPMQAYSIYNAMLNAEYYENSSQESWRDYSLEVVSSILYNLKGYPKCT